jgi:hypothetical protein
MPRVDGAAGGGGWRVSGVYAALLAKERERHERYGRRRSIPNPGGDEPALAVYRRPRHMLDALEAGQAVTVPAWRLGGHGAPRVPIPRELKCWPHRFVVSPDDTVVVAG